MANTIIIFGLLFLGYLIFILAKTSSDIDKNSIKDNVFANEQSIKDKLIADTQTHKKIMKTIFIAVFLIVSFAYFTTTPPDHPDEIVFLDEQTIYSCIGTRESGITVDYEKQCEGKQLKITAFGVGNEGGMALLNIDQPKYLPSLNTSTLNDFTITTYSYTYQDKDYANKYQLKGVFDGKTLKSGDWNSIANIKTSEVKPIKLSDNENTTKESLDHIAEENTLNYARHPVSQIDAAKKEGIKMLEDADTAIRNDVTDRRKALEAAAIEHRRINTNGAIMTDGYTMADGRLIICTTKVLSSGTFMDCNGEP